MEDALPHNYGHRHRAFLQALLSRGTMTLEESRPIVAAISSADGEGQDELHPHQVTEDDFDAYLSAAAQAASLFDYEIRSTRHQLTKQRVYAIVNTASDPQTQLATTYTADELSFIKRVLDAMFDKYNTPRMEILALTELQAVKLARPNRRPSQLASEEPSQAASDKGLKHSEVETVLASLVDGGWFEKSSGGFYSLSPRALLELRSWLVETYNDPDAEPDEWQRVKKCEACKDLVTWGLRCAGPECTLRLHDICQEAFWKARREKVCPKCTRPWTDNHYVGERAVTTKEAYQRAQRRGGGRRSTLADEVAQPEGLAAEEEEEEEEEE